VSQYLVPFPRYSASNNGVTLKYGLRVTQGQQKKVLLPGFILGL